MATIESLATNIDAFKQLDYIRKELYPRIKQIEDKAVAKTIEQAALDAFRKHNIRALRKQVEATDLQLAKQEADYILDDD
jgi:hypothetical protein